MLISAATSGGTESILMSVKTHRDWARVAKSITRPEMYAASFFRQKMSINTCFRVIPSSAHAAFWKASEYFNIKLHVIAVNQKTRKADVKAMKRAINPNTIMIVGSAPNFPDGAIVSCLFKSSSWLITGPHPRTRCSRETAQHRPSRRLLLGFIHHAIPRKSRVRWRHWPFRLSSTGSD